MADQYKNMMIALFICAAAGIITFILLFIHPSVGDEQKTVVVLFADIDKVNVGTRVTYGGKPVGEVISIRPIEGEQDHRMTHNGQVYLYAVEMRVDSGVRIFDSDEVSLRTSGLLGEKSVAILPMAPRPGQKLRSVEQEKIYAREVGSVEETLQEFKDIATKFELVLDNVNRIIEQLDHDKTFKSIAQIANNLSDISEALNKPQQLSEIIDDMSHFANEVSTSWDRIDVIIDNFEVSSNHVRSITASLDQPDSYSQIVSNVNHLSHKAVETWDTVDIAMTDLANTAANTRDITHAVNQPEELKGIVHNTYMFTDSICVTGPKIDAIVDSVYRGEGTVGALLRRDDLYLRMTSLFNKAEVIANDINHYGILFHLDKGWQRLRARRLNLLAKLSTPQEFRNYFNDEIDQITTSLSRVEMVLEKNSLFYPCGLLLDDNDFAKVYAGLLRRVEGMEEALKMYNQQVIDQQLPTTELVVPNCPLLPCRG